MDSEPLNVNGDDWDLVEEVQNTERLIRSLTPDSPRLSDSETPIWTLPYLSSKSRRASERKLLSRLNMDDGYAASLEEQIPGLDPETKAEISKEVASGRILSRRSSTALAVNFFQPWRSDMSALGAYLDAPWLRSMAFEEAFPTELSDKPVKTVGGGQEDRSPTLDVVLDGGSSPTIAIEAKFTEPYFKAPTNTFAASYFKSTSESLVRRTARIWHAVPTLQSIALAIDRGYVRYQFLHAAQLIKHALGLVRARGRSGFRLNYVWFDGADELSTGHRREIEHFTSIASNDIHVGAISYQDLASHIEFRGPVDRLKFVRSRYFDPIGLGSPDPLRKQALPGLARPRPITRSDLVVTGPVSDEFGRLSPTTVLAEYRSLADQAPNRHQCDLKYFVEDHNRLVGKPSTRTLEPHLQRALVDKTLHFDAFPAVRILDYEIPTKISEVDDRGLGKADLFGIDETGNHVIVELKVERDTGTRDSPVRALLEGLTYSAVLTANREAIRAELVENASRFRLDAEELSPTGYTRLLVAAPSDYWRHIQSELRWLEFAERTCSPLARGTGLTIQFVDLGPIRVAAYASIDDKQNRVLPILGVANEKADSLLPCGILASWQPR